MMSTGSSALRILSGVGAKGPACFLLEAAGKRIMLDLGEGPPPGLLPKVEGLGPLDALVLSHGHKDHVGGIALLAELGNPPVYAPDIVARELPKGIDVRALPVKGTGEVLGIMVQTGRNGHAPGGIWLRFAVGGGFLYTGDWSAESILYAYDPPSAADVALVDCSYGCYEAPIAECWNNLAPLVRRGPLLLPVPANGRGPELALQLARGGFNHIFVDEAMQKALQFLCEGDPISLCSGIGNEIERLVDAARPIDGPRGVMLAAAADGTSGATARLFADWEESSEPAIVFTGYIPPGTPAERMIKNKRAQFVRWNVHPRLSDLIALARSIEAKTVVPAFCDRSHLAGLAQALAPTRVTMDELIAI